MMRRAFLGLPLLAITPAAGGGGVSSSQQSQLQAPGAAAAGLGAPYRWYIVTIDGEQLAMPLYKVRQS